MKRIGIWLFLLSLILVFNAIPAVAQATSVAKIVNKSIAKKTITATAKHNLTKDAEKELAEQYTKRQIRKTIVREASQNGSKSLGELWIKQTNEKIGRFSAKNMESLTPYVERNKIYLTKLRKVGKAKGAAYSLSKGIIPSHLPKSTEVQNAIDKIVASSPNFFKKENFKVITQPDGYWVKYIDKTGTNNNVKIFVRNDGTIIATSAKKASGKGSHGNNDFLLNLFPKSEILVDDAIKVKTDALGRKTAVEADITNLIKGEKGPRNTNLSDEIGNIGGKGYEGGHTVQHSVGGPDELEVPMHYNINHNKLWRRIEDAESAAAINGSKVSSKIELVYEGDSQIPSKIIKTSTIDGEKIKLVCDNKSGIVEIL